jgi:hypothetical protein
MYVIQSSSFQRDNSKSVLRELINPQLDQGKFTSYYKNNVYNPPTLNDFALINSSLNFAPYAKDLINQSILSPNDILTGVAMSFTFGAVDYETSFQYKFSDNS